MYETAAVNVWAFLIFPSLVLWLLSVNIPPVKRETRKRDAITIALPGLELTMLRDEKRVPYTYSGDVKCRQHYDTYEVTHTGDVGATQHFVTY